jgi:glycosyltransferase involved in cell wall biosynthesis
MNHVMFSLARFLRDRGVRADLLLVDDEFPHFHPSCDTFDDEYRTYTATLGWGSARSYLRVNARTILRDLAPYDVVIGCGFLPAFCEKIGRPLDLFVPYGADVYLFPFGIARDHWVKRIPGWYVSRMQRRGIERARRVHCVDMYGPHRQALRRLGIAYAQMPCTPIYYPQYERITPAWRRAVPFAARFDALRDRYHLLLFSPARQYWKHSVALGRGGGKGNDVLIEGFAAFLRESGRADVGLILFEYGDDIAASRALVHDLGIGDHVHWFPLMRRAELMYGALLSDCGADQFPGREHDGAYGSTAIELMSVGKPVFGRLYYSPEQFQQQMGFPMPPLLNVLSSKELAASLHGLVQDAAATAGAGKASRDWAREHYGGPLADRYVTVLSEQNGHRTIGSSR